MTTRIPEDFLELLQSRAIAHFATVMPDGAPQLTPVWIDVEEAPEGHYVLVNSKRGRLKNRNVARRPQVAVEVSDPGNPFRYISIRGRVVAVVEEGAAAHLERLSQRYLGRPYPWWGPDEVREIFRIAIDRVRTANIG
jgi:PPOX class probable F420-dependent enzyme